ncbi:hypothetical protein FHX82_001824 [Amycolatopsis bartoniae]|nr:hypothetical protein [Amycolatopsis bartoniae]MBB2934804.1 hypothetical protein [Amycolatopsis bartoniae]TVT02410.1 hypothetical protein FNH07_27225 [Amycolatopsis bartoniae]
MRFGTRKYWGRLRLSLRSRRFLLARRALACTLLLLAVLLAVRPPAGQGPSGARASPASVPVVPTGLSTVPIHLADAAVAGLLTRGAHVDVVTVDDRTQSRQVLAGDATVVDVRSPPSSSKFLGSGDKGPLVLIALPRETATEVAALSLRNPVAVTLR